MYQKKYKRVIDILIAFFGILFFIPIGIVIVLLIILLYLQNPFFTQDRVGKDKKIFKMIKFRTMTRKTDEKGVLLSDNQRVTSFGKGLRKYSIDEIPQLWNVLVGDMSIVGPRPLLKDYMYLYTPFEDRRHEVLPGITGWAQINGRNLIPWKERFDLDVFYVNNCSFILDLKIMFRTFSIGRADTKKKISVDVEPFSGTTDLVVVGEGVFLEKVVRLIKEDGRYHFIEKYDSNDFGSELIKLEKKTKNVILAVNDPILRNEIDLKYNFNFSVLIHINSDVSKYTKIGDGTLIFEDVLIEKDGRIGKHVCIMSGVVIGQNCNIKSFVSISEGVVLKEFVEIDEMTVLGKNVFVSSGVKIGKNVKISDGIAIYNDVKDGTII